MKNLKKKKKFLSATMAFFASACVLAGSVFAWWVSNDSFTGTNLQTGDTSLEIELYLYEVDEENQENSEWIRDKSGKIVVEKMIPGDSRFYAIKIKNTSSFIGLPTLTLQALTSAQSTSRSIKDYNYIPPEDPEDEGTYVQSVDDIMLSKMIILDIVTDEVSQDFTELPVPTPRIVDTILTAEDQTLPVEHSIYLKTEGITKDYKYVAQDIAEEPVELPYQDFLFFIVEFHFSGAAGNDYQNAMITMDLIKMGIDQKPDSDII